MAFLESLRATNIFPRKPATDRPFGMPDIDDGNVNKMLNQAISHARTVNDEDMMRQQEMMRFEQSLRNRPAPMSMTQRAYGGGQAPMQGSIAGQPAGFAPLQRMFQARDAEERDNKFKAGQMAEDRSGKLTQAMEEGKLRSASEMEQLGAQLGARREEGAADRGSRERISTNELAARMKEEEARRTSAKSINDADNASRERVAGMPARTQPTSASQQGNQFENRIQQLGIDIPGAAGFVIQNPDTKQYTFKPGTTPEQQEFIRNYLAGKTKKPAPKPPIKPMTSRDK